MQHQQQHVLAFPQRKQMRPQRNLARKIKRRPRRRRQRPRKLPLAHRFDRERNLGRRRRQHLLPRHPMPFREDRAQALVSLNHIPQRSCQCRTVKLAPQPQRQRDRVGRARILQPMQEPQPALRIRQRKLRRS